MLFQNQDMMELQTINKYKNHKLLMIAYNKKVYLMVLDNKINKLNQIRQPNKYLK